MPHITLEYTSNINQEIRTSELFGLLYELVSNVGDVAIENCKGRVIEREDYHIGSGGEQKAFVHLCIRMLAGRSNELKSELGRETLKLLKEHFAPATSAMDLQITVEIQDIAREAYFKEPGGSLSAG